MKKLFLILGCMLLSACATVTPPGKLSTQPTDQWILRGKMGLKTPDKAESASVYWMQAKENYDIKLFGPLGLGAVELQGKPGEVRFVDNQGKITQAASPELLLQQNTGWNLPVTNLRYWIRAKSAPHIPSQKSYNQHNQLLTLQQEGWTIQYLSYQGQLPHIIELSRPQLNLRLVINGWQFYQS